MNRRRIHLMSRIECINLQIERISNLKSVSVNSFLTELYTLKERLNDKTFRIAVVGEFSSGKSTFINAVIGKDVLKHAATETTATVTYIHNVLKDDPRKNTCEIEYVEGNREKYPHLDKLRDYTTVNSNMNVAESIKSVSIYVNFLNVDYPILIADTPGLNGIADRHREITLEEIKKAHACIYLLSSNGVKSTDSDFINILLNYQKRFIFIQNFIDLLRISEGETLQSKINKDIDNLNVCLGEDTASVNYDLFGISAVKALAAKDLSKTKVFEEDEFEIVDRKKLYEESNFSDFENCLYNIINSGEYLKVIESSAIYTLNQIIKRIKNNLDEECKLNDKLMESDDKTKILEKAQKIIDHINSQKNDQKKRLEKFIISRDSENRRSLCEFIKRWLDMFFSFINKDLDEKIKTYEDFVTFADYNDGYDPPKYYSKYLTNQINGELIPDIDSRIQDNLSHLYDEAIIRVSSFITSITKTKETIDIDIDSKATEFNESSIKSDFEKCEIELSDKRSRIENIEATIRSEIIQKTAVENDLYTERQRLVSSQEQYERDKKILGGDPGVKKKKVPKTNYVDRTGFLHGFRDWLFGKRTETYWVEEDDYAEQNNWKRRKKELEEKNKMIQERHMHLLNVLNEKKSNLQDQIQINSNAVIRLKKDIAELEKRAEREKEIYKETLKANKNEYCENEKRKLKEEIHKVLLDEDFDFSVICKLHKHINETDLNNLPAIQRKVLEYYDDSVKLRIESLNAVISGNKAELEKKYELSKKELSLLNDVIKKINEIKG